MSQDVIIELRTNDTWLLLNRRDVKCLEFSKGIGAYRDKYNITIVYYGREKPLEVEGYFTEEECSTLKYKLVG